MESIGIAGTGRLAQALGRALVEAGEPVRVVAGRNAEHTRDAAAFVGVEAGSFEELAGRTNGLLIAVSDDAITPVASILAGAGFRGVALHTCGARGIAELRPLADSGVSCGVLHPVQTIPNPRDGVGLLQRITFSVTASGAARDWARRIATVLGGSVLDVAEEARPAFHAAGVMAGNYATALMDAAAIVLRSAGIDPLAGLRALETLAMSSVSNAVALGPEAALTGPVSRGDCDTVSRHIYALRDVPETVRAFYVAGGLHALAMARRRGLAVEKADEMERILKEGCG